MMLSEVTTVPDAALPVEEFKAHLRLGSGFGTGSVQDVVLVSFLRAAVTAVEARTSKVLFEREFMAGFTVWRESAAQALPIAPVSAVSNVVLVDRTGVRTDVGADTYWLERDMHCPRLRAVGTCLPPVPQAGMVEVVLTAGYGPAWTDIPADLRQAVLLLAAHYYEYRDETALSEGCMPFGVASLIERYKVVRLYGGGAR
ncbi:head-tail connector protein [uncultured Tateyamaria sp.]|uniref:head-tail connector protein n=1 Tax=Tateyamaria sp. 1078 TaxID=3417464 RepID=UPI002638091F|nr:head-tail connector protein [uncultured Tateyamaria sp.]